jgi:hypothetical protein
MRIVYISVATALLLVIPAMAADLPPDLTKGGERDKMNEWTLGPTGARGWIWGHDLETTKARQILVTKVNPHSPAKGLLQEGDVVLGVDGKIFSEDARKVFARAITEAEKTASKGRLSLVCWRKGKQQDVVVTIPVVGDYSATAPYNCQKTARIVDAQCKYLLKNGFGDGVQGNVNALGALATGRPAFASMLREYAGKVGPSGLKLNVESGGMTAWDWGYANLFLSEYCLATKDKTAMPAIREYALNLAKGQSGAGTWGHGMAWTKNNGGRLHGPLGGYGAMNQPGLVCFISLILARECGVKHQEVDEAIVRAARYFRFYVNRGAIPYGDHEPWYDHDDNGKSSSGAVAFDLLGDKPAAAFFSRMAVAAWSVREAGHTGHYLGNVWGPLGAGRAGPDALAAHMKELHWYLDLERKWDGGSEYQCAAGADDSYKKWDCTGARLLANSIPLRKLRITGKGAGVADVLKGDDLKMVIESDRGLLWSNRDDLYAGRDAEELLRMLGSWSPAIRRRAAKALAAKGDESILSRVTDLLQGPDTNACYGACMVLEQMKGRAAEAVPALTAMLSSRDLEVRIRAINALAGIGAPARDSVPEMLKLALQKYDDDPREITQRYISVALFRKHGPGLLSASVEGIDRDLLFRVIQKLLQNEDGHARSSVASVYGIMKFEVLKPLLPDICRAIEEPAPSGEMFAAGVRDDGLQLLAANRVKEAIPLLVKYAKDQQQWGSENRIVQIMKMLESYGVHAKPTIPELKKFAQWCRTEEGFPDWARDKKREAVEAAIKRIEAANEKPELISIPLQSKPKNQQAGGM